MLSRIKIAAIQMIANPAPAQERLARAEMLLAQAAQQGAQLTVLPELFNTGYEYSRRNYQRSETLDGPTAAWMKRVSAHYGIHLAGSLFHSEGDDIYNTLLLIAPDGRQWRYDKSYPWYWERAYFRRGKGAVVADTNLGKIGMLVCWDVAHPKLWQVYAGRVDLVVVCSCPPAAHDMTLVLPDGSRLNFGDLGPVARRIKRTARGTFGVGLLRQSSQLAVPVVNTTGTGVFSSALPSPRLSLAAFALMAPRLWKYMPQADHLCVEAGYFNETYIADASGKVLQQVPAGVEGFALADVALPDALPNPHGAQPPFGISIFAYLFDVLANLGLASEYRRKKNYFPTNT
jgi:predicted amidohydrolase